LRNKAKKLNLKEKVLKKVLSLVVLIVLIGASSVYGADYGFVIIKGSNQNAVSDEAMATEKLIKSWDSGKVLVTVKEKTGIVKEYFVVKFVFQGDKDSIISFLKRTPYEGDLLEDVCVEIKFSSYYDSGIGYSTNPTKVFTNVEKAVNYVKNANKSVLIKEFKRDFPKAYKTFKSNNGIKSIKLSLYSFSIKDASLFYKNPMILQMGFKVP
jgi:hypothetical protein